MKKLLVIVALGLTLAFSYILLLKKSNIRIMKLVKIIAIATIAI
jgi:hypothetical protein